MQAVGLVPKSRMKWIPAHLRFAHEVSFFLHDEMARVLVEVERAEGDVVAINFKNKAQAEKFEKLAQEYDAIEALQKIGLPSKARRLVCNRITMAMISDCLHHIYEALRCLEKRKFIVALNLLRKPLKDSLIYLSWMLGNEEEFYNEFMSGDPEKLTARRTGNRRKEILQAAIRKTYVGDIIDPEKIIDILFNSKCKYGLEYYFQHAVHLVTVERPELKTSPQNFNFIFKNYNDDDIYEIIYSWLPYVLLFLSHVVLNIYSRMTKLDKSAVRAFVIRSKSSYLLTLDNLDGWVAKEIGKAFNGNCEDCNTPLKITKFNAALITLRDRYRCTGCGRVNGIPFSWMF